MLSPPFASQDENVGSFLDVYRYRVTVSALGCRLRLPSFRGWWRLGGEFGRDGDGVEAVERDGLLAALHLADELDGIRDETRYSSGRAIRTAVSMLRLRYWRSIGLTT